MSTRALPGLGIEIVNRAFSILALLALLPILGMIGFMLIEGWSYFDALYMSVITLSTVGFHEIHPLSDSGRAFVIVYLVGGLGVFFYGVVQIGEFIVRAELQHLDWLGRKRMDRDLKKMDNHFIICGAGRMGRGVCRQIASKGLPFVVVDRDEEVIQSCHEQEWIAVHGDATDDHILQDAGLDRARGLATVLNSDADNLYVILSARLMAPELPIIARATEEQSVAKMRKAGANRVISLFHTGAMKMAHMLSAPELEDFIEIFTTPDGELDLAEIHVAENDPRAGMTLEQTDFSSQGVVIVGIRRSDGQLILPPAGSTPIQVDDQLIALGKSDSIAKIIQG